MRRNVIATLAILASSVGSVGLMLAQGSGSADETVRQAVAALAANDRAALEKLSIDEAEFRKYIWPRIAAQMSNTNADKYFPIYKRTSGVGITEANAALAGHKWQVVKVSAEPAPKQSKGYQLFLPPEITLRDDAGQEKTMKLIGGLLAKDGSYKVTTYYVSPSQKSERTPSPATAHR
jgi:hypothetical protein